jgi:Cdc6-like AAA superfamily ATPase
MGEAGTGKTALLKHVSEKLYESQFETLNINAGTKVDDLRAFLKKVRESHTLLKSKNSNKKLWIFFDEFNTLKEVGYIKEIMIDKRFEGE